MSKLENNIYHDKRCVNYPYYVNIMRRGISFYKKFATKDEAINARDKFKEKMRVKPSNIHPLILETYNGLLLEVNFSKTYNDDEKGRARALKIATTLDKLMDEEI